MKYTDLVRDNLSKDNGRFSKDYLEKALSFVQDDNKEERREKQFCKCCYYLVFPGTSLLIHREECWKCGTTGDSRRDIDSLCFPCSQGENACRHCGANMD